MFFSTVEVQERGGVDVTKGIDEGSEVGYGVGRLLG